MRCNHCHDRDCPGCCDECPRCDGGKRGRRLEEPDYALEDDREFDYQAKLDAVHAAKERHLEAWRVKR